MRISLNWLQELVDITTSAEALAELLTMAGFEVEDIEDRRTWAKGVVVGRVLSRQQHPNADKLSVCEVDIGAQKPAQIVCGAANVGADQYVPVATLGTYLPRIDLKIKPAKLRGVASEGMICSLTELGLTKESEGIHILGRVPESTLVPGTDVRPLLGLDDVILDVTSTANRADVLSMVGLAREVAAITGSSLKLPGVDAKQLSVGQQKLQLQVQESQACPRYIGTILEDIEIQPSPDWLQRRLQSAGIRPINNVVDVTNLVLLEWGQPLHAFDRDRVLSLTSAKKLGDLSIGVRYAESQETLQTLDGQSRSLQPQNLVIVAGRHPIALAGVMGGEETEVTPQTQSLILEAAVFDAAVIRRSARAQGLRTEASIRYERGVNSAELDLACNRALQLLQELAGAKIVGQSSTALPKQWSTSRSIALKLERVRQVLGPVLPPESESSADAQLSEVELSEVSAETVERTLSALGCTLKSNGQEEWQVTVPPYRYRDLEREIDLIEEIARLYGYNNFADTLPAKTEPGYLALDELLLRKIRGYLRGAGLTELVHYSVVKPDHSDRQVVIANPLFAEYSALRTDLVSGLIEACQLNVEQGNGCLNGFEMGRIFGKDEGGLQESDSLAGILGGERVQGAWVHGGQPQPLTWYEAKGILDGFFGHLGVRVEYQPDRRDPRLHPGRTASLWFQGDRLGIFGQLHPQLRQERDLPEAVYVFEISLEVLLNSLDQDERLIPLFKPFSTYPPSDRDIAFFAPVTTAVADLQRAMNKAGGSLLESIELFDEYRGEHVPTGQRSLAFRLVYRASDRTLTDSDIDPVHQKVRDVLQEQFGVTLRS